ncbi:MAG: fused MFS/spermidine synthase [Propionibacteriaceae bacterium]|nr:fused MFS/spermidine synthase [Propionibacteriaceae bacterium]
MDPRLIRDRERTNGWIVQVEGIDQSYVDLDDPTYLGFDYVERIVDIIDLVYPAPQRITAIHVGGAGMTIPRYLTHTRPTSGQVVFEPDASLTQAVREVAPLVRHSGIKVRAQDGRTGIKKLPDHYSDVIVVDAFAGSAVPADLGTVQWFAEVARVLTAQGTLIMNLTDLAPFAYSRRVLAGIIDHFTGVVVGAEPSTWKGRRFGNLVVGAGPLIDPHLLGRTAAGGVFPYRLIYGLELARWVGKAQPFTDQDCESSPKAGSPPMFR